MDETPAGYTVDEHVTGQWTFSTAGMVSRPYDSRAEAVIAAAHHSSTVQKMLDAAPDAPAVLRTAT